MKAARRDLEHRLEFCGVDVGPLGFRVIRMLNEQTMTSAELSRRLRSGATGLVPVIDALEAKGLVQRGRDPRDRRRTPLTLTASGKEVLARVASVDSHDSLGQALNALGPDKTQDFLSLLRQLVANLTDD
jgi:DNA-binding MarR family transcriptional regulator